MRTLLFCVMPALLLAMTGCDSNNTTSGDASTKPVGTVVAKVNDKTITEEQLNNYAERRAGTDPATLEPQIKAQLLNELINIELLAQAALADKLHEQSPLKEQLAFQRETAMADAAMTQYLEQNPITDEDVRAEYEQRKSELGGTEYKARHILVESEETARNLIAELDQGADFVTLAKENSTEPGADQSGGDLGWFSPAQMVPPFAAAITAMQAGERSQEPVQTQYGWHVIAVEDTRDVPPPAFEDVAPQIQRFLTNQRIQAFINELRDKAEISENGASVTPAPSESADQEVEPEAEPEA